MDGAAAEAIRKLQATLDALKKQRLEDRKGMAELAANFDDLTDRTRRAISNTPTAPAAQPSLARSHAA